MIYTADGKIKKRAIAGGAPSTPIEFTAAVSFTRTPYQRAVHDFDSRAPRPVRGIMAPVISPDGTQVAFAALGDLWLMPIGGTARRLTNDRFVEMDPTWSPDGRSIAFSSDRDGTMDLWVRDLESGAERRSPRRATKASWAPRGTEIAYITRQGALAVTGRGAPVHAPMRDAGRPTWAPEGMIAITALQPYSSRFREGTNQLILVSTTGGADRQSESGGASFDRHARARRPGVVARRLEDGVRDGRRHARDADDADGRGRRRAAADFERHCRFAVVGGGFAGGCCIRPRAD